jgi:hypothetical protein
MLLLRGRRRERPAGVGRDGEMRRAVNRATCLSYIKIKKVPARTPHVFYAKVALCNEPAVVAGR